MSYSGSVTRSLVIWLTCAALLVLPAPCLADTVGTIIPAYFYPGSGGTDGFTDGWAEMAAAASKIHLTAVANPSSGPGPSADPNYKTAMANLEAAGGHVVGYIFTDFGARSLASVESDV